MDFFKKKFQKSVYLFKKNRYFFVFVIIFGTVFFAYGRSLENGFVFDDHAQIEENWWIREIRFVPKIFTSGVWVFREFIFDGFFNYYYRPLMHVFFLAEYLFLV